MMDEESLVRVQLPLRLKSGPWGCRLLSQEDVSAVVKYSGRLHFGIDIHARYIDEVDGSEGLFLYGPGTLDGPPYVFKMDDWRDSQVPMGWALELMHKEKLFQAQEEYKGFLSDDNDNDNDVIELGLPRQWDNRCHFKTFSTDFASKVASLLEERLGKPFKVSVHRFRDVDESLYIVHAKGASNESFLTPSLETDVYELSYPFTRDILCKPASATDSGNKQKMTIETRTN